MSTSPVLSNDENGFKILGRTKSLISDRYYYNRENGRGRVFSAGSALLGKSYQITTDDSRIIDEYNDAILNGAANQAKLDEILKGSSKQVSTYIRGLNGAAASQEGLAEATRATGLASKFTAGTMKALSIAGSMVATMLISWGIQAAIKGIQHLAHAAEEAKEELDEFNESIAEGRKKLKDQSDFINSDEVKELDKLSKGVDAYGESIYLSSEQMDRYHTISNKVADMFPDMVRGWDDQGNAILNNKNLLEQLNAEYEKSQDNFYNDTIQKAGEKIKAYNTFTNDGLFFGNKSKIDMLQRFIDDGFVLPEGDDEDSLNAKKYLPHLFSELKLADIDDKDISESIEKQRALLSKLQSFKNEQSSAFAPMKEILAAQAYFTKKDLEQQGKGLSEIVSNIVDSFINSMTWENSLGKSFDELNTMVNDLIIKLKDNPDLPITFDDFVKLDKSSLTEAEYEQAVQSLLDDLKKFGLSEEAIIQIKLAFDVQDVSSPERDDAIREKLANALGINSSKNNATLTKLVDDLKDQLGKEEIDVLLNPDNEFHVSGKTTEEMVNELVKQVKEKMKAETVELEPKVAIKARLEKLDNMSDAFKSLKTAMDEVTDDGKVAFSTIETLAEKLGDDVVEKYADTLMDTSSSAEGLSKALTSMTQDYIDARIAAGEFDDADENMLASMLDEAGIANAVEVAHDMITQAKLENAAASVDLTDTTGDSIAKFENEATALGLTETAIGSLSTAFVNAQNIMTIAENTGAITRLKQLGIELQAIQGVADAYNALGQAGYVGSEKSRARWRVENGYGSDLENAVLGIGDARENINKLIDELSNAGTTPTFKPSDNSSKSAKDAAKAQKDYDKKVKDINEQLDDLAKSEALEKLKYKFDQIEASITKIDDALGLLKTTLDLQAEDDYIGKIETVTYQMDLAQQKTGLLVDEFNQLKATAPTTADMAKEIADRMKSVTESITSNRKDMIDYAKSVTDYYMSAAKSIGSMQKDTLSKATSLFERNVKTLTEGGLSGLRFSITPTVPQSAYKKQRQDNQSLQHEMQKYYDAVAKMQKTALDMQYQEQIADNERKRQELAESLAEAKGTLQEALAEASNSVSSTAETVKGVQKSTDEVVKAEQKDTNKKTSEEQKKDDADKVSEAESFSSQMEGVITDLNDWMVNNPITAPGLDTSAWEGMVSQAESYASRIQEAIASASAAVSSGSAGSDGVDLLSNTFDTVSGGGGKAAGVLSTAKSLLGTPYVWGGTNPNVGLDCSGFVQYVYGKNGVNLSRTTYTQINEGKPVSKDHLQPGDLVFYGKGSQPTHVTIYAGNGQVYSSSGGSNNTASNPGKGVILTSIDYRKDYFGARRVLYATGTETFPVYGKNPNGVVSENHKPETIMNKRTGKTSIVDEPALIDTREYDIIGEKQTAEILKNQHANGTFDNWNQLSLTGGLPKLTVEQIQAILSGTSFKGSAIDKTGAAQGIYNAQQKTGVSALYTLTAAAFEGGWAKSKVSYGKNNYWGWGHYAANGKSHYENATTFSSNIGEAFADYSTRLKKNYGNSSINSMASMYVAGTNNYADGNGWRNGMTSVLNSFGKLLSNRGLTEFASASSALVDNTGETASNTANTATAVKSLRQDFKTQLQNFLAGTQPSETDTNKWEDDLLSYIKKNVEISSESNEKFIEMWDKMQAYQDENTEVFKALDQKLLDAVGTDEFASVRNEIAQITDAYTNTIIGMQSDLTTEQFKVAYAQANDVVGTIRAYFNQRKAEDAGADELKAIADALSEAQEIADGLSDDYVAQIQNQTDYLISMAERVTKPLADELSWLEKTDEELERQQELTSDISEQFAIMSQREDNYSKQLDINRRKQEAAHQAVLDMNSNENYKEILRRFDIETWFYANAEFTEQFTSDLERMALTMPELVPYMKQYAEQVQAQKKTYYEAGKAIEDLTDKLRDIGKQKAETNVDVYVQVRERVQEHTEFKKSLNDAKVEIQQAHYDFIDTLREEQNAIDAELAANKHLSEWLSEDTRKQLFNDADWAEETAEIARLREEAEKNQIKYQQQISNLRENEQWQLEGITAEYNKQMDALQDQLSIAKQKLQTAKDQAAIENAMRERDIQIIMGNRVQNVADPDKLYDLEQKAQQSRLELLNQETKSAEAAEIRDMQRVSDDLGTIISNISYMTQAIENLPEAAREIFATLIPTTEDLEAWLHSMDRDSVYSIINDDLTESAFMDIVDLSKTQGFSQIYDHSAGAETIARDIVEGLIADSDLWRKAIYGEMQNHDNKNLVDPYNNGYREYGVGEWIGTGKRFMDTYPVSSADELAERERIEQSARELLRQAVLDEWNRQHASTVISGEGGVEYLIDTVGMKTAKTLPNGTVVSGDYQPDPDAPHTIETTGDLTISGEGGIVINGQVFTVKDWDDIPKLDLSALAMPKYDIFTGGNLADIVKAGETNNDYSKNFYIDNVNLTESRRDMNSILIDVANQTSMINSITKNQR